MNSELRTRRAGQTIIRIGQAMLELGLQNTHSGNLSIRLDQCELLITKSGSRKGHLTPTDLCRVPMQGEIPTATGASIETGSHRLALALPGIGAVAHGHARHTILYSFLAEEIRPCDLWSQKRLGTIPIRHLERPVGSPEMEAAIPAALNHAPAMVVAGHGIFAAGAELDQAFHHLCLLESVAIQRLGLTELGLPDPTLPSTWSLAPYRSPGNAKGVERTLRRRLQTIGHDIFSLHLSPYLTGALSLWAEERLLYMPQLAVADSTPVWISDRTQEQASDDFTLHLHRHLHQELRVGTIISTLTPEALVTAQWALAQGREHLIPDDAEGALLYPHIPILPVDVSPPTIAAALRNHPMAIVAGYGVVAWDSTPERAIHHTSSLRTICSLHQRLLHLERAGKVVRRTRFTL